MTRAERETRAIVIDSKEATQHPILAEKALAGRGSLAYEGFDPVTVAPMEYGDIRICLKPSPEFGGDASTWLIVEIKTWEDLHSSVQNKSITDTRIRHQLNGLLELKAQGHEVCLMIVGVVTEQGTKGGRHGGVWVAGTGRRMKRNWSFYELEQIRLAVQRLGIPVYQVASRAAVPHALWLMAELFLRKELFEDPGLPPAAKVAPKMSFLTNQLTGVDGVGSVLARRIAKDHPTFAHFYEEATVETLQEIENIGKVKAQQIFYSFHDMEGDEPQGWDS